jgi:hypothetical protein
VTVRTITKSCVTARDGLDSLLILALMSDQEGVSPRRGVLRPLLLLGVFVTVASLAGLAMTVDAGKAQATIAIAFVALVIPSLVLLGPFVATSLAPAWGDAPVPVLGARAATVGCAGFAALFGLAVAIPLPAGAALIGVAVGLGLIAVQFFRHEAE